MGRDRAQANLPALAVALLVVTTAMGLSVALADGAFSTATREPGERRVAVALGDRLVSPDSWLTTRANVVDASRTDELDAALDDRYPVASGWDVRVALGGRVLVERGDPTAGTTVRRLVLVERRQSRTLVLREPRLTLPRRTPRATLTVDPSNGTTVTTVRANGRVVLHDPDGLDGEYGVDLSRYETTRLTVAHGGPFPPGDVSVTYYPAQTTKGELVVTVDD